MHSIGREPVLDGRPGPGEGVESESWHQQEAERSSGHVVHTVQYLTFDRTGRKLDSCASGVLRPSSSSCD